MTAGRGGGSGEGAMDALVRWLCCPRPAPLSPEPSHLVVTDCQLALPFRPSMPLLLLVQVHQFRLLGGSDVGAQVGLQRAARTRGGVVGGTRASHAMRVVLKVLNGPPWRAARPTLRSSRSTPRIVFLTDRCADLVLPVGGCLRRFGASIRADAWNKQAINLQAIGASSRRARPICSCRKLGESSRALLREGVALPIAALPAGARSAAGALLPACSRKPQPQATEPQLNARSVMRMTLRRRWRSCWTVRRRPGLGGHCGCRARPPRAARRQSLLEPAADRPMPVRPGLFIGSMMAEANKARLAAVLLLRWRGGHGTTEGCRRRCLMLPILITG